MARPERRVDVHDLRAQWYEILDHVVRRRPLTLTRAGVPIARIVPIKDADPTEDDVHDLAVQASVQRLAHLVGRITLSAMLGESERAVTLGERHGWLPERALPRLDYVIELVAVVERHRGTHRVGAWFRRPQRALRRQTPAEVLSHSWTPGEPVTAMLMSIAGGAPSSRP